MAGYDSTQAEGFIRLFGMPLAALAQRGLAVDEIKPPPEPTNVP